MQIFLCCHIRSMGLMLCFKNSKVMIFLIYSNNVLPFSLMRLYPLLEPLLTLNPARSPLFMPGTRFSLQNKQPSRYSSAADAFLLSICLYFISRNPRSNCKVTIQALQIRREAFWLLLHKLRALLQVLRMLQFQ